MSENLQKLLIISRLAWVGIVWLSFDNYVLSQSLIVPDNTLGNENSQVKTNVNIRGLPAELIEGGAQRKTNLFHSFSQFNVEAGRGAYFANPEGVTDIFSRVTGGNLSKIMGTLGVNGSANLFFINPNGIIFGENSSLDVRGSFLGSTANSILFDRGFKFGTINPEAPPLLTVKVPIGLNLGNNPGDIVNQSVTDNGGLRVLSGQNISLIGGNVNLDRGLITAPGGTVELGGLSTAGSIAINEDGSLSFPEELARTNVSLTNGAEVNVRADGGGFINVNAQNLTLSEQSRLFAGIAENGGATDAQAGDITINATESVRLIGAKTGLIGLDTEINNHVGLAVTRRDNPNDKSNAIGNGGAIVINTDLLEISNQARITANSFSLGDAGDIIIKTKDFILNGETIGSLIDGGIGNAGNVVIENTNNLVIDSSSNVNRSAILSQVINQGQGNAGDVTIDTGSLILKDASLILADNQGIGDAGNITINANDAVALSGGSAIITQELTNAKGDAGNIEIDTGSFTLEESSLILADNQGTGNAGNITINARDLINLDGKSLILSQIQDDVVGNAGDINLSSPLLTLSDFSLISTNVNQSSVGKTGNILLNVGTLRLTDGAVIDALTENNFDGGDILINANLVDLSNGGKIVTSGSGGGNAGSLNLNISNTLIIDNSKPSKGSPFEEPILQNLASETGLFANTVGEATGNGGSIDVQASSIQLENGGSISTATSSGDGGNITLNIEDILSLRGDSLISAEASSLGNGGNIEIDTETLVAFPPEGGNGSDIVANAVQGQGGRVDINAQGIFGIESRESITPFNDITASSELGISGEVNINTTIDFSNSFEPISPQFVVAEEALQGSCFVRRNSQQGSFVYRGVGGLPVSPSSAIDEEKSLSSQLPAVQINSTTHHSPDESWRDSSLPEEITIYPAQTTLNWQVGEPIIEPTNLIETADGRLLWVRKQVDDSSSSICQ